MQLIPYLNFNGNCAEAMAFYASLLACEINAATFAQMPADSDMPPLSEEDKTKIMNAELIKDGKVVLYAGDTLPMFCDESGFQAAQGMQVAIDVDHVAEGLRIFEALAVDGQVQMPFAETFWAGGFGVVTDRFGTPWVINAELRLN